MAQQIWHVFYYDRPEYTAAPCRSEVIEAADEEAAAQVARAHLGVCKRASLEAPSWMHRTNRIIFAADRERRSSYLN